MINPKVPKHLEEEKWQFAIRIYNYNHAGWLLEKWYFEIPIFKKYAILIGIYKWDYELTFFMIVDD